MAMQQPRVAGVAGGVGTSTVAAAVAGMDGAIYRGGQLVHVLVCRSTMASLGAAQRALHAAPMPPVLAVVADIPRDLGRPARARLWLTEPHAAAVVHLPFVLGWRDLDQPWEAARSWLQDEPPRELRAMATALNRLVDAVTPLLQLPSMPSRPPVPTTPAARVPAQSA